MAYPLFLARWLARTGLARFLPGMHKRAEGGTAFLHYYSDRVLSAPRPLLERSAPLIHGAPPDTIDLCQGTPRFDAAPTSSSKVSADRRGWPSPWGLPELRAAVADHLHHAQQLSANPDDEILITAGALGAFHTVLDTFLNRGDRVVLLDPTSPLFPLALHTRRARLRWLPTTMDNGRLRVRLADVATALRGARLLVLCSPGNPTGGILAPEDLEQIAWWAERHDVLIYSDEVFHRFHYEHDLVSIGSLPRAAARTLTAGSLSKSHALTSLRVGWLSGHRHLIRPCVLTAVLRTPFVPTLCQQLALTVLRQRIEAVDPLCEEYARRRRYAYERLRSLGLHPAWPAGGLFFWVPVPENRSGRVFAEDLLREKKVQVAPGDLFGPSGVNHVRISYALEDGRLREGLNRVSEFLCSATTPLPLATAEAA